MRNLIFISAFVSLLSHAATYRDEKRGFSFEYDSALWKVVPPSTQEQKQDVDKAFAQRTLVNIQRNEADERYHARFSVVVDGLKQFKGATAEKFTSYQEHALNFLKSQNFQDLTTKKISLPGVATPAFEIEGHQRSFGLKFRQVIFLKNDEAYLLTVATRTNKFEAMKPETDRFFGSFQMSPQQ